MSHPFMTTVYPSSDGYFQKDNAPCHKAQIISDWFLEHDNEFTLLKWPPQSPDLNPIEHLWDVVEREICIMDVQPTNLQQLRDAIMSIWTKFSEECFQHLVESMPRRLRRFWRQKGVQPGTRKVCLIKWPVSVYIYIKMTRKLFSTFYIYSWIVMLERLNMIGILILTHSHCKWDSNFLNVLIQTKQQMWLSFLHHQWHATLFNLKYLTYLTMYILFT